MRKSGLLLLSLVVAGGCSSSSGIEPGTATVDGPIQGHVFSSSAHALTTGMSASSFDVLIAEQPLSCAVTLSGGAGLELSGEVNAPGVYHIVAPGAGPVIGAVYYPSVTGPQSDVASSGTLTLTTLDASGVAGSFDLTFIDGSHVTGEFDAPVCPQADAGATTG